MATRWYEIVRYYHPSLDREDEVVRRRLTLAEAQKHCRDPRTDKRGEYFDGYRREQDDG